ncbi:hypothetical protein M8T34_03555 [Enterobacter hormaechei]|uniref:hypothetical protein n=2 Tax=Enterobacter TaxID=547 RepID=UPI002021D29B|nr:hypothetical protein [Enterobacter hormaechei]MCL8097771.1 hypothetical protein [Enterobacter hormaechei]MCM8025118.1 hypothetical protein [Enterobacter hormaechei]MCM8044018.1 hypothetical protein [Enterobacter hormaechei]
MNSSDADRLIDQLIGEAALSLLKERDPVTTEGLVQRLRNMQAYETDPQRRETLARVIADISSGTVAFKGRRTAQGRIQREGSLKNNRDNVVPLFGNGKPSDPKKIHCLQLYSYGENK